MTGPNLVIKQRRTPIWYVAWSLLAATLLVGCFLTGRFLAVDELARLKLQTQSLENRLARSQQAFAEVSEQLVMQQQSLQVDNQSNEQLISTVKNLQSTQKKLEEELNFYRNIMAPELKNEGLTIADFSVSATPTLNQYRFKLALTQAGKQEQFLKGKAEVRIRGRLNGEPREYPIRELGTFNQKQFEFQFKYFQNIEGVIDLPTGFVAEQIDVRARTQGLRKNQTASRQLQWTI